LERRIYNNQKLVYLDNASTTQKPISVINAICKYYQEYNSNIHRAVYQTAEEATFAYESTRKKVANFINAKYPEEIVFTKNATEAINLVAYSWARNNLKQGDVILLTDLEHHSNIVPWIILNKEKGVKIEYVKVDDNGYLDMSDFEHHISNEHVKLVSITNMSNALGTITPVQKILDLSYARGIPVLIDGAQSVPHMKIDVQKTRCSFLAFSGHKMLGPTGVGILYINMPMYDKMTPFISGGDMIKNVYKDRVVYNDPPQIFVGGTPNIADVIGFGYAIDYLDNIGMSNVWEHEVELTKYALRRLYEIKKIILYGPNSHTGRGGIISFNLGDIHPHDMATIMNEKGIAIRSGHHCAQILMDKLNVSATSRVSFYLYNTKDEIDKFINVLEEARRLFKL
jgi:cysteine desulfurase/selenocysteine lyase